MKHEALTICILVSLLLGLLSTILSTQYIHRFPVSSANCGFSLSTSAGSRVPLKDCVNQGSGLPLTFVKASLQEILRNFHTVSPLDPTILAASTTVTISWPALVADWSLWTLPWLAVGVAGVKLSNRTHRR